MEAVTIHDSRSADNSEVLAFDLIDILRVCEPDVLASTWRISCVECLGPMASELMHGAESKASICGNELLRLAAGVYQVIWGDFEAFRPGADKPWLVVRAVDSTLYVVISDEPDLIGRLRTRFRDVRS